ncbi:MAG: ABC transporter ATP-binding protein [Mycoplasmataceae bacterium]|nr:ABC transporter ATP-binding protein [Mycoplasmataceae bacterium]
MKKYLENLKINFTNWKNDKRFKNIDFQNNIPAISIKNYTKKFKEFVAVENINMSVSQGKIHGFIGPNGSGKTTIIKTLIGAYLHQNGEIKINKYDAGTIEANSLIGYIPERASFPSHLNCFQYLQSMAEISGFTSKNAQKKATDILIELKLLHLSKKNPNKFSSGMQKKILLAQALLNDPKILILDEPAANLDPVARKELFDVLFTLRNSGKSILISSHILTELERIVDEVTFIHYGKIIYSGDLKSFENLEQDVYIKSENNKKLSKHLNSLGYVTKMNLGNELVVQTMTKELKDELYYNISITNIKISVYRSSDLMSIYDYLLKKEERVNINANI